MAVVMVAWPATLAELERERYGTPEQAEREAYPSDREQARRRAARRVECPRCNHPDGCRTVAHKPLSRTSVPTHSRGLIGQVLEERAARVAEGEKGTPVLAQVENELRRALKDVPAFNSPHEGYAVILEELDELWSHVKANTGRGDEARKEAVQVAAMAVRYVLDLAALPA